jgi:hypothetical protein
MTQQQLDAEVQAALQVLQQAGADTATLARLGTTQFVIGQLPGDTLSLSYVASNRVVVDASADGWGWSADTAAAPGHMDLLTDVLHEMGHMLGLADLSLAAGDPNVMNLTLPPGARHMAALDAFFSGE